ncbi:MAG: DUF3393 domain-containing protein [Magnetococcales bacterium]|nr:DUF3393 domain-containing protein [Magnetococcales bacterium]
MKSMRRASRTLILMAALLPATGCEQSDVTDLASRLINSGGDVQQVAIQYAEQKARAYLNDPDKIRRDWNKFKVAYQKTKDSIAKIWGRSEAEKPSPKVTIKYTDKFRSRAMVDFDNGIVRVETVNTEEPVAHLREMIIVAVLTPDDPRKVDFFSDDPVDLSGTPYLLNQVLDHHGKSINTMAQAEAFADHLINAGISTKKIKGESGYQKVQYVTFNLVEGHADHRAARYKDLVSKYGEKYGISRSLIYAIIKTESNFNRFAVSWIPAFGLMQIVPKTAGQDAYQFLYDKKGMPDKDYLFDPDKNIEMGTAYIKILKDNYLKRVTNSVSREYCVIASYNGGIGTLLRAFDRNQKTAFNRINEMTPAQVHARILAKMPEETQNYLKRVLAQRKRFAGS